MAHITSVTVTADFIFLAVVKNVVKRWFIPVFTGLLIEDIY